MATETEETSVRTPRDEVPAGDSGLSEVQKVEQGAGQLLREVKGKIDALFHSGKLHLAQDIRNGWAKAKADALATVESNSPEVRAAAEKALAVAEKFLLDTIESHLA